MTKVQIYTITFLILIILVLAAYYYLFNIYEVTYTVNPKQLFADNHSTVTIKVIPINALGWQVPFRQIPAKCQIIEGNNLVQIVKKDSQTGTFILSAKDKTGIVVVRIKSRYSLLPSSVEIHIYPNYAFNKK